MPQLGLEVLTCQLAREEISRRWGGRCGSCAVRGGLLVRAIVAGRRGVERRGRRGEGMVREDEEERTRIERQWILFSHFIDVGIVDHFVQGVGVVVCIVGGQVGCNISHAS